MNIDLLIKQKEIVTLFAQSIDENWCRILVNDEIEDKPDSMIQSTLMLYIKQTPNGLEEVSVKITPQKATAGLYELNKMMADSSGRSWSCCELTVDADGKYKFDFSYEPPKRISGIFDEESYWRFSTYLDQYKAEIEKKENTDKS